MGKGKTYACPQCGYSFHYMEGHGMMDQMVFEKDHFDLLSELTGIPEEQFPAGCEAADRRLSPRHLGKCTACGRYAVMYTETVTFLPTEKKGTDGKRYRLIRRHSETCGDCGGTVKRVSETDIPGNLVCPMCHNILEEGPALMWD